MVSVKGIKMSDLETGNVTFDFSIYRWVEYIGDEEFIDFTKVIFEASHFLIPN
jgi:hypothetical protein